MRALQSARRAARAAGLQGPIPQHRLRWQQRRAASQVPQSTYFDTVFTTPTAVGDDGASTPKPGLPVEEPPAPEVMPGDDDRGRFQLHWSVDMWTTFYPSRWLNSINDESAPVSDRIQAFTNTLTSAVGSAGILGSTEAARYWAYHLTRSGYFIANALAGLLATRTAAGRGNTSEATTRMEETFRNGWAGPFTETMLMYYQDHENIKEGRYALPWDMTTQGHRQFNPLFVLQRSAAFVNEAIATLQRRDRGVPDDVWLKSSLLPEYYQNTFHYQTDGWLSPASARVYETSTETLFVGRQDAMQRCTLVPLADFMAGKDASQLKALEVAAGTGRFATFVKDNYPGLQLTVSDLSPFYLAEARNNIKYWKKMRAPEADFGGADGTGVTFLQTPAEKLNVPDNSQDIVYCVYLFHELPPEVRKQAAAEMARVVKPGGIVILTDSMQLGDREVYEQTMGNFGNFNEPYYRNYVATPLGPLFEAAGLKCGMKVQGSTSKALSFYKPTEDDMFAAAGTAAAGAEAAAAQVAVEALEDE